MGAPSPFELSRAVGTNIAQAQTNVQDRAAIDEILERAAKTQNPADLQREIGQVLQKVSPERQQNVMALLQERAKTAQQQAQIAKRAEDYKRIGLDPALATLPESAQAAAVKENFREKATERLLQNITGFGGMAELGGQSSGASVPSGMPLEGTGLQGQEPRGDTFGAVDQQARKGFGAMSDDALVALTAVPGYSNAAKAELQRRQEGAKESRADIREARKETLKTREDIVSKANSARQSIQNKENLLNLIDQGNLDDPTMAVVFENLPFQLGKRLLSDDTVTYKAGLVDEFKDLRNIFQGQTRVAELDILQEKLADLYLTDSQKKAVLKSRMDALQSDVLREEAAAEADEQFPNLGLLQFNRKVSEILAKKQKGLFNQILEDQKHIINQAEVRKQIPLDPSLPQDKEIMTQILIEAGGNKQKAFELSKKKGYKFK